MFYAAKDRAAMSFTKGRTDRSQTAHLRQVSLKALPQKPNSQTPSSLRPANVRLPVPKRRTSLNIGAAELP